MRSDFDRMRLTNITIETVDHGHNYQQGLRAGRIGIYFAPPHCTAWTVDHHGFRALVHLSEPLAYIVTVEQSRTNLFEVGNLASNRICDRKPLNLDYILISKVLENSSVPTLLNAHSLSR